MMGFSDRLWLYSSAFGFLPALMLLGAVLASLAGCVPDPDPKNEYSKSVAARAVTAEQLYTVNCGICHSNPDTTAPTLAALRNKSLSAVMFALLNGNMRGQAQTLSAQEKYAIATFITDGKKPYQPASGNYCENRNIDFSRIYAANRGFNANNTAAASDEVSNINSSNVRKLGLKWVFELPDTSDARSQPVVTNDTLFIAAAGGDVFALDRSTACIKWHYHSPVPVRTSLTLHKITKGQQPEQWLLLFGDSDAFSNALDAQNGELVWRTDVAVSEHSMLTGAATGHENLLIVPVSLYEVVSAADPEHECCKAHGALHRLNASTGEIEWTTQMTEDATPRKRSKAGTQLWGPSGVPVWSTPTIDHERGLVYLGTGQNASLPATSTSDSIIAISLGSGDIVWRFQAMAGDTYNGACSSFPKGPNCPARPGPDHDFGASVIVTEDSRGRAILLAGQKSGDIFALDPNRNGAILWRTRVGSGSWLGGIHWGMAVADGKLFAATNDPSFPGYSGKPGLYALDIDNGDLLWRYGASRGCKTSMGAYFRRESLYPDCSFYFAFSAALSVANDVVFAPSLDGKVRAFDTNEGALLWQFNTALEFETTTGTVAHGGSMDNVGVVFAGSMVYMQSGYSLFGQLPGNILLAFELEGGRFEQARN
jgi:polyvinyl alcohol dehydrogenase (cytochrome)